MIQEVEKFIKRHELLTENQKVLVGVSGGPDSMSLLHFLLTHKDMYKINLVVAHVDHMFRGKQSEEDAQFVKQFCETKGITFEGTRINVIKYMNDTGKSSQVAARECRYQFYRDMMKKHEADILALGHHGDDQIETMLMRLVNGVVETSAISMPVKRNFENGTLIRPFLCITKSDIEQYCKEQNIGYRIDPSNEKDVYLRNRFRAKVLPALKEENISVHLRFQQFSEILNEDALLLNNMASELLESAVTYEGNESCSFKKKEFIKFPKPLQRRGIHLILNYLYKNRPVIVSTIHIENCLQLINDQDSYGEIHLPCNLKLVKSYDHCQFTFEKPQTVSPYEIQLALPGFIQTPMGDIKGEVRNTFPEEAKGKDTFICDIENVVFPLVVRSRKAGDRVFLQGINGSKKVKDIFIDEKIPHVKREIWPIIEDAAGNIIWIPGLKHSKHSFASKNAKSWIYLSFQKTEMH